ncbi:peptidylprolyl isomerase [Maritimibacter sp. DP1N21-5]|uniref:peptidylprolyl isomerase n=1 Tax=Maritimibacter sp. DP1N21-5 TaxID=2836867 RepID=UPI001C48A3E1|nr:peptidylprolyl isomerase [Maritimibacter sp. DP1N21-5]MBV7411058.1 peptidylprolyl isomerase [Maritimibacter sp. DP1N21-5]
MTHIPTRTSIFAATLLSASLSLPTWAQDTTTPDAESPAAETAQGATETETPAVDVSPSMVIASVNGEDITLGHVVAARGELPQQYQQLPDEVLLPGLVDQLIQQTLLSQAIDDVSERVQIELDNTKRMLVAAEQIESVISDAATEEAIQSAYDAQYADAEPTDEWNASHILVETEEEAADLAEQARAEGADFAALAQEFSTGPSGPNGGELGWFSAGMMVPEFETAVSGMDAGAVSDPVQTQFGWHVIKLNEVREKGAPTLDEVREQIVAELQSSAVEDAIAELMEGADIQRTELTDVPPSVLSDPSIFE